jgi:hypothetical protein
MDRSLRAPPDYHEEGVPSSEHKVALLLLCWTNFCMLQPAPLLGMLVVDVVVYHFEQIGAPVPMLMASVCPSNEISANVEASHAGICALGTYPSTQQRRFWRTWFVGA